MNLYKAKVIWSRSSPNKQNEIIELLAGTWFKILQSSFIIWLHFMSNYESSILIVLSLGRIRVHR